MTNLQYIIARATAQLAAEGKPSPFVIEPAAEPAQPPSRTSPLQSARAIAKSIDIPSPPRQKDAAAIKLSEDRRMAEVERHREAQLIAEAESAAQRRRIARCEQEIRMIENRPANVDEKAYLVAMGIEDWKAEKRLLEGSI